MHAIEVVLAALRDAGIEAFLAYGTLLGAVREGKLLGHDSDADLGYVSRHTHPVDVIRESFRHPARAGRARLPDHPLLRAGLQGRRRRGRRRGPGARRLRRLPDGRPPAPDGGDPRALRGVLDLPARHHHARGPHLPGAGGPRQAAHRDVRRPWRTPDPAFKFAPPATTVRRLNGWFRGLRVGRASWDRIYSRVLKGAARAVAVRRTGWPAIEAARGDVRRPRLRPRRRRPVHGRARRAVVRAWTSSRAFAAAERQAADDGPGDGTFWRCNLLELRAGPARPGRDRGPAAGAPAAHRSAPGRHPQAADAGSSCGGWPDDARRRGRAAGSTWSSSPASATTATPGSSASGAAGLR